jgi:hypothetical protein
MGFHLSYWWSEEFVDRYTSCNYINNTFHLLGSSLSGAYSSRMILDVLKIKLEWIFSLPDTHMTSGFPRSVTSHSLEALVKLRQEIVQSSGVYLL